jgi:DUF1365 family protein
MPGMEKFGRVGRHIAGKLRMAPHKVRIDNTWGSRINFLLPISKSSSKVELEKNMSGKAFTGET